MAKDYRLATIFCHVSTGDIPPELFKKLNSNHPDHADIYGIRVYRKIGTAEKIGGFIVPVYLFVPALIVVAILGYFGGNLFIKSDAEKAINQTAEYVAKEINSASPNQQEARQKLIDGLQQEKLKGDKELSKKLVCIVKPNFTGDYYCNLPKNVADQGKANFKVNTVANINKIKQELEKKQNPLNNNPFTTGQKKDEWIGKELDIDPSILQEAINSGENDIMQKNELIYAVYKYQKGNSLEETGFLNQQTTDKIMEAVNKLQTVTTSAN
jgi:hypothetical protein